jgi:lipopolysaccharide transport system ATP-binding protein
MSDIAIKFENISKQYRLGLVSTKTLSHDLNRWWQTAVLRKEDPYLKIGETNDRASKGESEYVWALRDINFEVKQGEILGIIGKNGAGKSTLLKILSRVTTPTTGSIKAKGKIASLLEVGTGFHPELTGRENIYMNGSIMGMTKKEITGKLDEIVEFAGVARYLDTPVKRYSSGMTVRLGFSIAAHLDPEILVVDEVLAVGDAEFQKKAIGKMQDVSKGEGRTVLFVSHQLNSIRALCNQCVLMKNGLVEDMGKADDIINKYLTIKYDIKQTFWVNKKNQYYNECCTLKEFSLVDKSGQRINSGRITNNENIYIKLVFNIDTLHSALCVGFAIYTIKEELLFFSYNTDSKDYEQVNLNKGENTIYAKFPKRMLNEGNYIIKPMIGLHCMAWIINPEASSPMIAFSINGGLSDSSTWQGKRSGILAPVIKYSNTINN